MVSTLPISRFNAQMASLTTVTGAASSKDLVTLATVKAVLGITDGKDDAFLKTMIGFVSAEVANYCNRVFVTETLTDEFWPGRDPYPYVVPGGVAPLQLSRFPLVAVTSVSVNDEALTVDADYRADFDRGLLLRLDDSGYPARWAAYPIAVTYSAGYATIPGDIQDAVCRLIKARRDARGRDPYLKQENIPGVIDRQWWVASPGEAGNMPPDVVDILDNYRVPVVA